MERNHQRNITRRRFLLTSAMTGGGIIAAILSKSGLAQASAPAIANCEHESKASAQ